jgi:hypothetical protein
MSYFKELFHRLRLSLPWVGAQFVLTLVLILAGLGWSLLPDKHLWQVVLALLVPLLLAVSILELEAGTMRALSDDDGRRVKLVFGACTLLVWVALFLACWAALDWCDDRISQWASYLSARASAGDRATLFTYGHILSCLAFAEWILRWIIVPGKIIPYAIASAQWGWRVPFRNIIRLLFNWRWWLAILLAALVAVALPAHFFHGLPGGTVVLEVWAILLELAATYLLAVACWVLLLAWAAVLLSRSIHRMGEPGEDSLPPAIPGSHPGGEKDFVHLPLPDPGDDSSGND